MFVHYFTHVPLNVSEVEKRLDSLRNNLTEMADVAYREGEELRSKVGPWVDGYAKEVELEIGTAELHRTGIAYPITWTATGAEVLFPKLNAELLLAHVGKNTTRIALEGTYEPPRRRPLFAFTACAAGSNLRAAPGSTMSLRSTKPTRPALRRLSTTRRSSATIPTREPGWCVCSPTTERHKNF